MSDKGNAFSSYEHNPIHAYGYTENQYPICPRCCKIAWHIQFDIIFRKNTTMPEFCPVCLYDLKKPISWFRKFIHFLFWGSYRFEFPLAHNRILYKRKAAQVAELERMLG